MQQDPVKLAAQRTHTNQFVDMPAGVAAVAGEFLQLGIHEGRFMAPVQPGSHLRKQQLQAGLEKHFNRRFPWTVMVADRHTGISSGVVWVRHASSFCLFGKFLSLSVVRRQSEIRNYSSNTASRLSANRMRSV